MKRILFFVFLLISVGAFSQSADEIIKKNIENSGGLVQWKLLNSIFLQGKVVLGLKEEYPIKIYQQRPNYAKTIFTIKNKDYAIDGYDGQAGYSMNFATNKIMKVENYIPESFDTDFIDYDSKGFKANFVGTEKIAGKECYVVELMKNVNKNIYYFDTSTYALIREVKRDETLTYSEFKTVGKLLIPFKIVASSSNREGDYVLIFNKIELNKAFPEGTFKF